MAFSALLQRIQRGLSTVELVHMSHPRWPLPPGQFTSPTLQISVLDSSFNPPTLAHLALANILPPPPTDVPPAAHPHDFDARLLLLSVRNADKQLKPGDASYEQRMQMMVLLAQDLTRPLIPNAPAAQNPSPDDRRANVAVAIIDEPTFVGKSAIILDFLRKRIAELHQQSATILPTQQDTPAPPKLTFIMGTDTIVRFFASRYYANEQAMATALRRFLSPEENDSRIICARRASSTLSKADEEQVEARLPDYVHSIAPVDRISFIDIGVRECTYSSSDVREKCASRDPGWRTMVPPNIANYIVDHALYVPPS